MNHPPVPATGHCVSKAVSPTSVRIHLDAVALQAVRINGAASRLELRLSAPRERVPIAVAGAVRALTLDRPAPAQVTVAVRGSVRDLDVEHRAIRAAAGPVVLGDPPDGSGPGYDLRIAGSVAGLRTSTSSV